MSSAVHKAKVLVIDKDKEKEKALEAGAVQALSPEDFENIRNIIGIGAAAAIDFVGMPKLQTSGYL